MSILKTIEEILPTLTIDQAERLARNLEISAKYVRAEVRVLKLKPKQNDIHQTPPPVHPVVEIHLKSGRARRVNHAKMEPKNTKKSDKNAPHNKILWTSKALNRELAFRMTPAQRLELAQFLEDDGFRLRISAFIMGKKNVKTESDLKKIPPLMRNLERN